MFKTTVNFTPGKRQREYSSNSDNSLCSPDYKRPAINNTPELAKSPIYHSYTGVNMASSKTLPISVEFDQKAPDWARQMYQLILLINDKIDNMGDSQAILEDKLDKACLSVNKVQDDVNTLQKKCDSLQNENIVLKDKLNESEAYSKKYNLKFFNIPDQENEDIGVLIKKMETVFEGMDLNLGSMIIDNIHRLPSTGRGPRPVIIKFVRMLDRNLTWSRREKLADFKNGEVIMRDHYPKDIEANIRKMLPVKIAAVKQGMSVKMVRDKVIINSQAFTVNNLHQLPASLKLDKISIREESNHLFFFKEYCPLSNMHGSKFKVDGVNYLCMEQFIMRNKADTFKDAETATKIMNSETPGEMKYLGSQVKGFVAREWHDRIEQIAMTGLEQKFAQNEPLKKYLLDTGDKVLVEASPRDSVWGIGRYMYDKNIFRNKDSWGKNLLGVSLMKVREKLRA